MGDFYDNPCTECYGGSALHDGLCHECEINRLRHELQFTARRLHCYENSSSSTELDAIIRMEIAEAEVERLKELMKSIWVQVNEGDVTDFGVVELWVDQQLRNAIWNGVKDSEES